MRRRFHVGKALALVALMAAGGSWAVKAVAMPGPDRIIVAQLPSILDIAVDRSDPSYFFLTTRSGLYRVASDGTAARVSVSRNVFWTLAPHPRLSNVLYARGIPESGENVGVIILRDSGRTWRQLSSEGERPPVFRSIDVSTADPDILYGLGHNLWVSRDGGGTWEKAGYAPDWPYYDVAASSLDPEILYVATFDGLHVSADGGRSWRQAFAGLCRQPVPVVETASHGVLYAFSTCDGLIKASEQTGEWVTVNNGFGGCIVQHLAIDPVNSDRIYAVFRCNKVLASNDSGWTWSALGSKQIMVPKGVAAPPRVRLIPKP